jgi:hypothetical protein
MSSIMQDLAPLFEGDAVGQVSQQLGVDEATASNAISAAIPLLLAALNRNAQSAGGADALHGALARDHDGSVLDDLGGFLGGGGATSAGAAILGHVLGGQQRSVQAALGKSTGLDAGQAAQLLMMLAPIIMGLLGKARAQGGLDAGGLAGLLGGEHRRMSQSAPDAMGLFGQLLDANHDGSAVDDVVRIGGGLLGGLFGRKG